MKPTHRRPSRVAVALLGLRLSYVGLSAALARPVQPPGASAWFPLGLEACLTTVAVAVAVAYLSWRIRDDRPTE